jgi:hypothetical protein
MADVPTRLVVHPLANTTQLPQPPFQGRQSFVQRLIECTVTLTPDQKTGQPNKFTGTDSDTITLSGFRTSARIENSGGVNNTATVSIYGMAPSLMNQLSTLGMIFNMVQKNNMTISAGDEQSGMSPVFSGTIANAFGDYNSAPNVPMRFECSTGLISGILPVPVSSFPQTTDVATIIAGMAAQDKKGFENNGVTVQLPPSYFHGTIREQIKDVAKHAHINVDLLHGSGGQEVWAIWPMGGSRTSLLGKGQNVPLVSKETGMIGSPSFGPNGFAIVKNLFNPQIAFGGVVHITSTAIPQANRDWVVNRMSMAFDSLVPKGRWDQTLVCYPKGFPAPVPPQASG